MQITIRTMTEADADAVARLADRLVGDGYYPPALVRSYVETARTPTLTTAYVAERDGVPLAFRFVVPPGRFTAGRGAGQTPERWGAPPEKAAYFQSCFVAHECMGQGIGGKLAQRALADLRQLGAQVVVAHSWKESPHNSSLRYLSRLGFQPVAEHLEYWRDVDYVCSRCGQPPCLCTAIEMVLPLKESP